MYARPMALPAPSRNCSDYPKILYGSDENRTTTLRLAFTNVNYYPAVTGVTSILLVYSVGMKVEEEAAAEEEEEEDEEEEEAAAGEEEEDEEEEEEEEEAEAEDEGEEDEDEGEEDEADEGE